MSTLFIADLHLSVQQPAITAGFLHFLQREASQAEALYILGDLFDAWIGDDDPSPLHREIATALYQLHHAGVPCYFIRGNRDFLLGAAFAQASGLTLLPEQQVITVYGRRILITHGDLLCTDDHAYQAFRRKVHTPWIQKLFLALPLRWRLKIAATLRAGSQRTNQHKSDSIMDVNPQAVEQALLHHQVEWLIHGHTHRPAIHPLIFEQGTAQRMVLGAWHQQGSVIKVTPDAVELIDFPF